MTALSYYTDSMRLDTAYRDDTGYTRYHYYDGLVSDIEYDQMGRTKRTSSPYYSTSSSAAIPTVPQMWTSVEQYDGLGRAAQVRLADSTLVQTAYDGKTTTLTDQADRQRRQVTDALGASFVWMSPMRLAIWGQPLLSYSQPHMNTMRSAILPLSHRQGRVKSRQQSVGTDTYTLSYAYNLLGRLTSETYPSGCVVSYEYDDGARLKKVVNGSGAIEARHDYLPFGEEIPSDTELRTAARGYGAVDSARQRYAGMERDDNGLYHTLWRKYDSRAGRWTTPDPYGGSISVSDPQSFNRYTYVGNDPVNLIDPSGPDANMLGGTTARHALQGGAFRSLFDK